MKSENIIIGGGIVGLMCAYMLVKKGHKVSIIDKYDISDNTSFGNAGLVSPFEELPLSKPGMITTMIKLMLKNKSPLIINGISSKIIKWLYLFAKNANKERVKKTLILFEKYGEITMAHYENMAKNDFDFDFHHTGVAMAYTNLKTFENDILGCDGNPHKDVWDANKTKEMIPCVNEKVVGSIFLNRNAHLNPVLLMTNLVKFLKEKGVKFILNTEILNFEFKNKKAIKALSKNEEFSADNFIIATGADVSLSRKTGVELMLTPAKGYSMTFKMPQNLKPKVAVLFMDQFLGFIPRKESVRITSKLELGNFDRRYKMQRFESILNTLKPYIQEFEMKDIEYWTGFRPLTPNDIPLFGRDESYDNIIHANGMGWLGITFGPAIGDLVSELIDKEIQNKKSDDVLLFSGFYQGY
jgi:D-amino-acid dehydrogenase